jgi:hypothetical protein
VKVLSQREALGAAVHLTKSLVYGRFADIDPVSLATGLMIGWRRSAEPTSASRPSIASMPTRFRNLLERMLAVAGSLMLLEY